MSTAATTAPTSRRRAALVAALGLLLMAVLAGLANFAVLERLVVEGDAAGTASAIADGLGIFRLAIVALLVVAVLDVIVALAFWALFDRVHQAVAVIAAGCRVLYAVIFTVAISHLVSAAQLLSGQRISTAEAEMLTEIQQFDDIWKSWSSSSLSSTSAATSEVACTSSLPLM